MYKQKYLKYKNKYIELKKLIGGAPIYNNLKFLGQGADNIVFLLPDNNAIRIRKNCEIFNSNELLTISKMKDNTPKYFVKILALGKCNDLKNRLKTDIINFCDDKLLGDICNYTYIIMELAKGCNILQYYGLKFKDLLNNSNFDTLIELNKLRINEFIIFLFKFLNKITEGLIDANKKLGGFIHFDLNYRNCNVDPETENPIIFDFCSSSIGKVGDNSDILNYIKDILSDSNLDVSVYSSIFSDYETKSSEEKLLIKTNFYKLNKIIREENKLNIFINKYFYLIQEGVRLNIKDDRESLETFIVSL